MRFCIVCGRGSFRNSWPNSGITNGVSWVACDFHSLAAIQIQVADTGGVPAGALVRGAQNNRRNRPIFESEG